MKFQLFFAALLCLAAASTLGLASPMEETPVTDAEIECVSAALRDFEASLEGVEGLSADVVETLQRLKEQRDKCETMNVENPSSLQQRLYEICRAAWSASVAYEMNRLRDETGMFEDVVAAVEACRS